MTSGYAWRMENSLNVARAEQARTFEWIMAAKSRRWRACREICRVMLVEGMDWLMTRPDMATIINRFGIKTFVHTEPGQPGCKVSVNGYKYWESQCDGWFTARSGEPLDLLWNRVRATQTMRDATGRVITRRNQYLYHLTVLGEAVARATKEQP